VVGIFQDRVEEVVVDMEVRRRRRHVPRRRLHVRPRVVVEERQAEGVVDVAVVGVAVLFFRLVHQIVVVHVVVGLVRRRRDRDLGNGVVLFADDRRPTQLDELHRRVHRRRDGDERRRRRRRGRRYDAVTWKRLDWPLRRKHFLQEPVAAGDLRLQ